MRLGFGPSDNSNLLESDLDDCSSGSSGSDSSVFSGSGCVKTDWRQSVAAGCDRLQYLATKIQSLGVSSSQRRRYRADEQNSDNKNYSIFDTPGSDRFHFGSRHGSLPDSMSLEWDPQDCYSPPKSTCRISDNPLAEVTIHPTRDLATFTVLQEMDILTPGYDTDIMVSEIDNITETTLRETNLWNIQVNLMDYTLTDTNDSQTKQTKTNLEYSTISSDTNSFSPMSTSLDSGNF